MNDSSTGFDVGPNDQMPHSSKELPFESKVSDDAPVNPDLSTVKGK